MSLYFVKREVNEIMYEIIDTHAGDNKIAKAVLTSLSPAVNITLVYESRAA